MATSECWISTERLRQPVGGTGKTRMVFGVKATIVRSMCLSKVRSKSNVPHATPVASSRSRFTPTTVQEIASCNSSGCCCCHRKPIDCGCSFVVGGWEKSAGGPPTPLLPVHGDTRIVNIAGHRFLQNLGDVHAPLLHRPQRTSPPNYRAFPPATC